MKRNQLIAFLAVFALTAALLQFTTDLAEGKGKKKEAAKVLSGVTITGSNYCFGCELKKSKGAKSQCSLHGHQHALKVTGARDSKGKNLKELKGWVLHYLATDAAQPLIKGEIHGDSLEVKGNVFKEERVLEVVSFKESK